MIPHFTFQPSHVSETNLMSNLTLQSIQMQSQQLVSSSAPMSPAINQVSSSCSSSYSCNDDSVLCTEPRSLNMAPNANIKIEDQDTVWNCVSPSLDNCADDIISLFGHSIDGASLTMDDLNDLLVESDAPIHSSSDGTNMYFSKTQLSYPETVQWNCGGVSVVSDEEEEMNNNSNALASVDTENVNDMDLFNCEITDDMISLFDTGL